MGSQQNAGSQDWTPKSGDPGRRKGPIDTLLSLPISWVSRTPGTCRSARCDPDMTNKGNSWESSPRVSGCPSFLSLSCAGRRALGSKEERLGPGALALRLPWQGLSMPGFLQPRGAQAPLPKTFSPGSSYYLPSPSTRWPPSRAGVLTENSTANLFLNENWHL